MVVYFRGTSPMLLELPHTHTPPLTSVPLSPNHSSPASSRPLIVPAVRQNGKHVVAMMAKGSRKHGLSNHERFLGPMPYGHGHENGGEANLVEEDIWSTMADRVGHDDEQQGWFDAGRSHSQNRQWREREDAGTDGLSLAFDAPTRVVSQFRNIDGQRHCRRHASAPVSVPDWAKILRVDSLESIHGPQAAVTGVEGDDDDGEWMPPHEYLARESAASGKMVATSVFEGVGRTLKGRDMSRVRNAVWRQTGFFG